MAENHHPDRWSHVARLGNRTGPAFGTRLTVQRRRVHMTQLVSTAPNSHPALVLNADFRPLSYYPLSLWPWQEVVKAVFLDRVDVISTYDQVVHSPSFEMKL